MTPTPSHTPTQTETPPPSRTPRNGDATPPATPTGLRPHGDRDGHTDAARTATPTHTLTPVLPGTPDAYEPDDLPQQAHELATAAPQEHTFHLPGDVDWVRFAARGGSRYLFRADAVGGVRVKLRCMPRTA